MNPVQLVERALGVRVEAADAVDLPIQHIDPKGRLRAHGKHVDQRAADREFAVRHDLRDRGIPGQGQLGAQCIQIEGFVDVNLERVGLDVAARGQSLQQRIDGNQPHAVPRSRQFRQGGQASRRDVRVRGKGVIGQGFQIRKYMHAQIGAAKESNFLAQRFGVACALRNHDDRARGLCSGFGNCQRRGGAVQLAPFDLAHVVSGQDGIE